MCWRCSSVKSSGSQLAHAAKTHEQQAREANGPVGVRDVEGRPLRPQAHVLGRHPLGDHLQVEVGGGQHDVLDAVDGAEIVPRRARFDVQLAQGAGQDIRPPAMGDEVELLQFRRRGQQPQELLQVKDGELPRFAVVGIAAQPPPDPAGQV